MKAWLFLLSFTAASTAMAAPAGNYRIGCQLNLVGHPETHQSVVLDLPKDRGFNLERKGTLGTDPFVVGVFSDHVVEFVQVKVSDASGRSSQVSTSFTNGDGARGGVGLDATLQAGADTIEAFCYTVLSR